MPGQFLEACHEGPNELSPWCAAVADTLTPLIAANEGLAVWVGDQGMRGSVMHARGRADVLLGPRMPQPRSVERQRVRHALERSPIATMREGLGAAASRRFCAPFDFVDGIALTTVGGGIQLGALIPLRAHHQRSTRERLLHRAQRHLQTTFAARADASWANQADLIIGENGRVRHAEPGAERLRRLATDIAALPEAGFGMAEQAADGSAELWNALFSGEWGLASVRDSDGQRMLLLKRKRSGGVGRLTAREREALRLAASDRSSKRAASELGVSVATFSTHLGCALRKLGLQDRSQLLRVTGGAR